jgi:hypothetical protein
MMKRRGSEEGSIPFSPLTTSLRTHNLPPNLIGRNEQSSVGIPFDFDGIIRRLDLVNSV